MPTIRQLSPIVINKIAAGEVIERPASVVKELLENAVDAGATRVDVTLEKGGSELIRVSDNGCGIAEAELKLAVTSHATSKITSAEDLFSVGTLGFRGEALASIASVSRMIIRSRTKDATEGAELEIVGGEMSPVAPAGCPVGTTMEVRNLFFNTPVRQKFLRTTQTETGHAVEAFTRLALAHPQVHFVLTNNGRLSHDLPPTEDLRQRIATFFGNEIADNLIDIDNENDGVHLHGYVANPMQSRGNNRLQYLLLNGRAIRDRALQHALSEAYRGLLLTGRHPICFLRLEVPAEMVDVNVHPTKQEVRFQDGSRLYSQLLGTLRTKFLTSDLTARAQPDGSGQHDDDNANAGASQLVAWAKGELGQTGGNATPPFAGFGQSATGEPLAVHRLDQPHHQTIENPVIEAPWSDESPSTTTPGAPHISTNALQVHDRYLITETADGIEIIDQHALHERILYERLRKRVASAPLESQKLLVPEPVDLTAREAALALEHTELLAKLGIQIEPFGGETVLVTSCPVMLSKHSPAELLRDLVERLEASGQSSAESDLLDELLHSMSCKAAVKFGDPLAPDEVAALLADRHRIRDGHHCPHGRPTTLVFTRDQLDRQFKRI